MTRYQNGYWLLHHSDGYICLLTFSYYKKVTDGRTHLLISQSNKTLHDMKSYEAWIHAIGGTSCTAFCAPTIITGWTDPTGCAGSTGHIIRLQGIPNGSQSLLLICAQILKFGESIGGHGGCHRAPTCIAVPLLHVLHCQNVWPPSHLDEKRMIKPHQNSAMKASLHDIEAFFFYWKNNVMVRSNTNIQRFFRYWGCGGFQTEGNVFLPHMSSHPGVNSSHQLTHTQEYHSELRSFRSRPLPWQA